MSAEATVTARMRSAGGFVVDMDGTLVRGDPSGGNLLPIPGANEFLEALRARGTPFVIFTNGTARTAAGYAAALRDAGLPVTPREVLTAADSAADVFLRRGHRSVMVLAARAAGDTLRQAGIEVVAPMAGGRSDAVLVGWFPQMRFGHIQAACEAVWDGAKLYSSSQTPVFATAHGKTVATSRLISVGIRDVTGRRVETVGKPSHAAIGAAARRLGCSRSHLVVIGDDPDLEIAMAVRAGALAVAVHTGIATSGHFVNMRAGTRPHLSLASIADVVPML